MDGELRCVELSVLCDFWREIVRHIEPEAEFDGRCDIRLILAVLSRISEEMLEVLERAV